MALWILTYLCLAYGLFELRPVWVKLKIFLQQNEAIFALRRAVEHLRLLEEMLESGLVPEPDDWFAIKAFPKPWAEILFESLAELRAQGAPVLPSLRRMQKTLDEQVEFIQEAKVKTSQAFGQALFGMILVPLFSITLYGMLPGIQTELRSFLLLALTACLGSCIAFIWMMSMSDRARFGNMAGPRRKWWISAHSSLERVLALISTGMPADLAWRKSMEELSLTGPDLVREWKIQVWDSEFKPLGIYANDCERLIVGVGIEVRRSIQTSLIEGRPCMDRIESIHRAFLLDFRARVSRELNLLPNQCMKPLFLCVLPSVFLLLLGSFALIAKNFSL